MLATAASPRAVFFIDGFNSKETDVAIACEVLGMVMDDELDIAVLITGDSDFAPVAEVLHPRDPQRPETSCPQPAPPPHFG